MAEYMAIEVAEYIERGLESLTRPKGGLRLVETPLAFLDFLGRTYHAGVLGLAFIGKVGDPVAALAQWQDVSNTSPAGKFQAAAGLLGVSVGLARWIELNHRNGVPAAEIAYSLRIGNLGLSFRTKSTKAHVSETAESSADSGFSANFRQERIHV